jgi:hypothetical protein
MRIFHPSTFDLEKIKRQKMTINTTITKYSGGQQEDDYEELPDLRKPKQIDSSKNQKKQNNQKKKDSNSKIKSVSFEFPVTGEHSVARHSHRNPN